MGSNASQLQHEGEDGGGLAKQSLSFAGKEMIFIFKPEKFAPSVFSMATVVMFVFSIAHILLAPFHFTPSSPLPLSLSRCV